MSCNVCQRVSWFYRQWTIKEATAKANGKGISLRTLSAKIDEKGDTMNNYFSHIEESEIDELNAFLDKIRK